MIPDLDYIRRKFAEFNKLCFGDTLVAPPFRLGSGRSYLGQITFRREKKPDGSWRYHSFVFRINAVKDLPQDIVDDTIIHEMIHYWILSNQMHDTAPHGAIFRRKMNEINTRHGRHITVSHRTTEEEKDNDLQLRDHLVCVTQLSGGQWGVTVAARSRLFRLWDDLAKIPGIVSQRWVWTRDPFFNRFPRSMTPKIYAVQREALDQHLASAKDLLRDGNRIMVKR